MAPLSPHWFSLLAFPVAPLKEPDRLIALDGELQTHGIACNDAANTSINDAIALVVLAPRSAAVEVMMLSVARPSDGPGRERPSVRRVGHRGCWFESRRSRSSLEVRTRTPCADPLMLCYSVVSPRSSGGDHCTNC